MATGCVTSASRSSSHRLGTAFPSFPTYSFPPSVTSPTHPHRLSLRLYYNPKFRRYRYFAAAPCPPPPQDPEPPQNRGLVHLRGLAGQFSRIQDRIRISFAVLFWMSLLFWASAWDGRSNGKRKKGSRFK